jgi:ethanolamine-phosphate cytidylyltransferase
VVECVRQLLDWFVGHVAFLEKARALGTFLYVGVHDDPSTCNVLGGNFPVMNMNERVLNVLACKWVDEVIIGAPFVITSDLLTTLHVQVTKMTFPSLSSTHTSICRPATEQTARRRNGRRTAAPRDAQL